MLLLGFFFVFLNKKQAEQREKKNPKSHFSTLLSPLIAKFLEGSLKDNRRSVFRVAGEKLWPTLFDKIVFSIESVAV